MNFGQRWFQLLVFSVGNRSVKGAKQVPEGSSAYSRIHTRSIRWCVLQSWLDVMQNWWHRRFVASLRGPVCAWVSHLAFCLTGTAEGWPTCCLRRDFRSAMSRMLVCSWFPGRLFVGILGLRRRGEKRVWICLWMRGRLARLTRLVGYSLALGGLNVYSTSLPHWAISCIKLLQIKSIDSYQQASHNF